MKTGRNDPCPCGSGRKYKKCCLAADSAPAPYGAADREAALHRLGRFRERTDLETQLERAEVEFRQPMESAPDGRSNDQKVFMASRGAFDDWFTFDRKGPEGVTPAEALLRREAARLAPGEREFITRLGRTELRLYEIGNPPADPGDSDRRSGDSDRRPGVDLIDRWSMERWSIPHPPPGVDLGRGALVAARLMPGPAGATVIEGAVLTFPDGVQDEVLALLRHAWRLEEPEAPGEAIFKTAAPVLHAIWKQKVARPPALDGDEPEADEAFDCAHVVFDVLDRRGLKAALAAHPELRDNDDDQYTWLEVMDGRTIDVVADIEIDGDELVLHLPSPSLVQRARRMIEDAAGDSVRHSWSDGAGKEAEDPSPEPRGVAVDWAGLERAFESSAADWRCYLDLRSGETYMVPVGSSQDGAGGLTEGELDDAFDDGHLLLVEPVDSQDEYGWMRDFTATVADRALRDRLEAALDGRGAFRGFTNALAAHLDVLDRWQAFRREQLHAVMRSWLEGNAVVPTVPAPEG